MKNNKRVVKDFMHGVKVFGLTIFSGFMVISFVVGEAPTGLLIPFILLFSIAFAIIGFFVNYVPLKVIDDNVSIPASDQIRTFTDLLTLNPITGLYRRRTYKTNEIENVANGYTRVKRGKNRKWDVVITGMKEGKSFSQRIDCSDKQVRDEVRNVLKQTIKGRVNSDFAI